MNKSRHLWQNSPLVASSSHSWPLPCSLLFGLVRNEALNLEALKSPKETCFLNFYLEINYSFHDEKIHIYV